MVYYRSKIDIVLLFIGLFCDIVDVSVNNVPGKYIYALWLKYQHVNYTSRLLTMIND